ncbi:MAG: sulfatase [Planctomycetota bacterium]
MQHSAPYWTWFCLLLLVGVPAHRTQASTTPNFVIIVADDLGWRDPGFMGSDYHRTPHLDRLASEGLVFEQAYANAAVCAPTRAALLSGMYNVRTGVYTVGRGPSNVEELPLKTPRNVSSLDGGIVTLPEVLQDAGYATGHFGKWHLGRATGATGPEANGFDVSVGASRGGGTRTYFAPYGISSLDRDAPEGEYLTDRLTDEAIRFVEDHREEPFFLWLAHYAVHTPIEADPDVLDEVSTWPIGDLHNNAEYAAMLASLDAGVGRLLDALETAGVSDNTVVVFVSDNGGGRRVTSMAPLKGRKGSLSEGGIRVPCVVRYPDVIEPGRQTDTPVLLFDLYPTLLEFAGARPPRGQPIDGVSWVPLLRGKTNTLKTRNLVWHLPLYRTSPRGNVTGKPTAVLRRDRWKLIHDFETGTSELYDLQEDIGETKDLAATRIGTVRLLERELNTWQRTTDAPVPSANAAYDRTGAP